MAVHHRPRKSQQCHLSCPATPSEVPCSTQLSQDRPRAKAVVELQGCRSRRSWGAATKKRVDLGSLCDIEHETAPPFVAAPQQRAFPKIRCDVTDRKASPDAPDLFFGILFWSSRPEHNQKPTTDTANRHCSLIPTRRKIAVFPQGGQFTAPLARGRSQPGSPRTNKKPLSPEGQSDL